MPQATDLIALLSDALAALSAEEENRDAVSI